jgi:enoyl-CoA hydratase/carnithine racemase
VLLDVVDADRVRLITLRRTEARNAFNAALYLATADALDEAAASGDLAVAVITGSDGAFSAGVDLAEMGKIGAGDASDGDTESLGHGFQRFVASVREFPKPLVAAVNGFAVGIGLTMLPYCDLVLVAESARLRAPFARLGVVPEAGSSHTLPAVMGRQAAAHALYTSEWIDAQTAVVTGLAWRRCPDDELLDEAMAVARAIARMPIVSLVETKALLLADRGDASEAARRREEEVFGRLTGAPANREAIAAFLEKREPDFTNLPRD